MFQLKIVESLKMTAKNAKICILISRFNNFINKNLLDGALDILKRIGQVQEENILVIWVPGAYELPITASLLAQQKIYDVMIALGTIIRGETSHFEYISNTVSYNLSQVSINNNIPIIFGILTTNNIEQAVNRSGLKSGNKGSEAAIAAIEMFNLLKKIKN